MELFPTVNIAVELVIVSATTTLPLAFTFTWQNVTIGVANNSIETKIFFINVQF